MCAHRSSPRKVTVTGQGWQSHAQKRTFLGSDHLGEGWREVRRVTLSVRGRCNRIPQRGQLKQGRFISDKAGGCQSKTKVPVLVTCQGPLSGSWSGWHVGGGAKELSGVPLTRALIPLWGLLVQVGGCELLSLGQWLWRSTESFMPSGGGKAGVSGGGQQGKRRSSPRSGGRLGTHWSQREREGMEEPSSREGSIRMESRV